MEVSVGRTWEVQVGGSALYVAGCSGLRKVYVAVWSTYAAVQYEAI